MSDIVVVSETGTEAIVQTATPVEIIVDGALKGDPGPAGTPGTSGVLTKLTVGKTG